MSVLAISREPCRDHPDMLNYSAAGRPHLLRDLLGTSGASHRFKESFWVSSVDPQPLATFRERLDELVNSVNHPRERRIAYGNLRHEYSEWGSGDEKSVNVAVIYETPGGSTVQINVTYENGMFSYLTPDGGERVSTPDPNVTLQMIAREVREIPERRLSRLRQQIEAWCEEGLCQRDMFAEMNKLLQSDFLGGSITQRELKLGIKHAIDIRRSAEASPQ